MTESLGPADNTGVMIYSQTEADRDAAIEARLAESAEPSVNGMVPNPEGDPVPTFPGALYPSGRTYPAVRYP
jgi:hypothetical protein